MRSDILLDPESEEEVKFIDLLADAREYGLDEVGLSSEEVSTAFSMFAIGAINGRQAINQDKYTCPKCGSNVDGVEIPGIGAQPVVEPCGCECSFDELPEELYLSDGE